jgi:hypothetical protein
MGDAGKRVEAEQGEQLHDGGEFAAERSPSGAEGPQPSRSSATLLAVQATAGNRATVDLLRRAQTKLAVGPAGDRYEQEADRIAADVVRRLRTSVPAPVPDAGHDVGIGGGPGADAVAEAPVLDSTNVQRWAVGAEGGPVDPATERLLGAARGNGRPLADPVQRRMGAAFGADFSGVRVHEGAVARDLNQALSAKAFTVGQDIFFGQRMPESGTAAGDELLAHELTHTLQQGGPARARRTTVALGADKVAVATPTPHATIQRALGDDIDWAAAGAVRRSGAGAEGVLFVTTTAGEIIVKFLKAAAGAEQADKTLRATGVEVPDSRIVANSDTDPVGGPIRALISSKLATLEEAARPQVTAQMQTYRYIQIQTKATGVPLDKLNSQQVAAFLADADLIQEVGKLCAVDSFLGNMDRLSQKTVNTGNYVLSQGGTGPTLIAIDNETKAKEAGSKTAREGEIRFVMSDAGADSMALAFMMKLTGLGTKYMFSLAEETFVKANIKLGIKAGAEAVIDLLASQPEFINQAKAMEKTKLPGPQGTKTSTREIVRKTLTTRLEAMQDAYAKRGWVRVAPVLG